MHGKSGCFALQKSRFRNAKTKLPFFFRIIFTRLRVFFRVSTRISRESRRTRTLCKPASLSLPKVQHPSPYT
ncbi:hypothetical protein CUC04_08750 [Prevotella intermedia]|uniref:Uncharacterized protein n=1 Tax=Prevotella intermedia TaxID=28131 RepID=A0A2G9ICH0_PREIN|nr:hypothetical protein CUC04_08750 [Prevotella intermedia]